MTPKPKQLKALSDKGITQVDSAIAGFTEGVDGIAAKWARQVTELVASRSQAKLADIVYVGQQVQGQLNRLGYTEVLKSFVAKYGEAEGRAKAALDAVGVEPVRLSSVDCKALAALRKADYAYMEHVGQAAVEEVSHQVVMNTLAGQSRAEMIEAIGKAVDQKFRAHASTYADTALVSYDRRVNLTMWEEAGITRYLYRGPLDVKTRPFCVAHVGKTFTMEEIDQMSNGRLDPPKFYGGGWGCRHVWSPVPPEVGAEESQE